MAAAEITGRMRVIMQHKFLAFDTSTPYLSVALCDGEQIYLHEELANQRHAELILTVIDTLLVQANMTFKELDAIAFGAGPGSFIGVRIATGVAQGIAFAHDLPVIPIISLQTLAQTAFEKTGESKILAGWDARMDAIYWGLYEAKDGIMQPILEPTLSAPEKIMLENNSVVAVGNAWNIYKNSLSQNLKISETEFYPSAKNMLTLANHYWQKNQQIPPEKAEPCYLRDDVAKKPSSTF